MASTIVSNIRRFVHIGGCVPYDERDSRLRPQDGASSPIFRDPLGFGPVASPPGAGTCLHPGWPATNPTASASASVSNSSGVADPRHLPLANLAIAASRSSRCHNHLDRQHFPGMPVRKTNRTPARAADWKHAAYRLSVFQVQVEAEISMFCHSSSLTKCFAMPNHTNFWGFVRRS